MPSRVLRDITDSDKVNALTAQAEVMFYRLMMKADDYGAFHAKPSLIKAALFPLRLDSVRETDISRWMDELQKAGLIAFYDAESKPYLVIMNFGQRMRNMKKRFPSPPQKLLASSCRELPPEVEVESETEVETETRVSSARTREEIFKIFRKEFRKHWANDAARFDRESDSGTPEEDLLKKRDKIIADALEKFWNHYTETGWKTKNNVPIVDRVASFAKWITREKQFAK